MTDKSMASLRSVRRCFGMIELFDKERRPMTASEISRALEAPLSSVIDLLKCTCDLDYTAYDSETKTYVLTSRLGFMGDWLTTSPLNGINYIDVMNKLHKDTKETITIFWQHDTKLKPVATLTGSHAISFNISIGQSVEIIGSASGLALMAQWPDEKIDAFLERAGGPDWGEKETAKMLRDVRKTRRDGYAAVYNNLISEVGAISAATEIMRSTWAVFCIGGLSPRIKKREAEFAAMLKDAISTATF